LKTKHDNGFPSRDAIVAFIRANSRQDRHAGNRPRVRPEECRPRRAEALLRELADDGTVAKRGRKIHEPATLPPTVVADITGRDTDGELLATPTEWDTEESGPAPKNPHSHAAPPAAGNGCRRRRSCADARREAG